MNKGVKLRSIIHNILYSIRYQNKNFDNTDIQKLINKNDDRDISFINNVCLTSMRYYFHTKKIIHLYVKKKPNRQTEILLISAITQIVFLDFKNYAVINSTVELSKKVNVFHGFINACLKKIDKEKIKLKKIKIEFSDLPKWFVKNTFDLKESEKRNFINNFYLKPSIHIIFKNSKSFVKMKDDFEKTSSLSGFLKLYRKINTIPGYKEGLWWVQDFSTSLPLTNISPTILNKKNIDLCSAPGGKAFQILSKNKEIILNDINKSRLNTLMLNLKRLSYKPKITNIDVKNLDTKNKYDFILLDSPCSAIGTIRKNPEIFFKNISPNIDNLLDIQKNMLKKSASILKENGIILYMVCSFLKKETYDQISYFLDKNKDFSINEFYINSDNTDHNHFIKNNYMFTMPTMFKKYYIDGFFAVYLRKKFK